MNQNLEEQIAGILKPFKDIIGFKVTPELVTVDTVDQVYLISADKIICKQTDISEEEFTLDGFQTALQDWGDAVRRITLLLHLEKEQQS